MNARRYRIRLYGHTNPEPQKFVKNLAALLGTDEQEARALLETAPVVIKEGLDKERANVLQETLNLMRALSIVETMDAEGTEDSARLAAVEQIFDAYRTTAQEAAEPWYGRTSMLGAIAVGLLLLCVIGVVVVPGLRKAPESVKNPLGQSSTAQDAGRPSPYQGWSIEELAAEWDALDRRIEDLQTRWNDELEALTALQNTPGADPAAIAQKKRDIAQIRFGLQEGLRERTIVERRIRALERSRKPAVSEPPSSQDESPPPSEK